MRRAHVAAEPAAAVEPTFEEDLGAMDLNPLAQDEVIGVENPLDAEAGLE